MAIEFRPYLKLWQDILTRAYGQKRLSVINYIIYLRLRNKNYSRYSSYF